MDEPDNDFFSEVNWGKAERSQHGLAGGQDQRAPSGRAVGIPEEPSVGPCKRQGNAFMVYPLCSAVFAEPPKTQMTNRTVKQGVFHCR